ncbi:protein huluwa-like [Pseudophryne corroboree]|uniref:protein huluwa-like n=1 Tax=Pseudophryne corroboree TaxID=495146 RepID=UPI003081C12E
MVSVATSLAPIAGGSLFPHVAPSAEEKLVLQPSLILLVFILIPCVVLLFFLNCFLLFHRLPALPLQRRHKRRGPVRGRKHCARNDKSAHIRIETSCPRPENTSMCHGHCASISRGLEATQALGESAQMYRDRLHSREWGHKLDETPGHPYSLRTPQLLAVPCCSSRSCGLSRDREMTWNEVVDGGGGTRSYSEQEMAHNAAPPNTPAAATIAPGTTTPKVKFCRQTSTQRKPVGGAVPFSPLGSLLFDHASSIPQQNTSNSAISSFPGPGLDSDFGVSAGISLHILSSDSDSCSQSWVSGMEWDYYDPCYMRKNRLRRENRQNHNLPVICSRQYWV